MTKEIESIFEDIIIEFNKISLNKETLEKLISYIYSKKIVSFDEILDVFFSKERSVDVILFINELKLKGLLIQIPCEYIYKLTVFSYENIANKCNECGKHLQIDSTDYYCNKCSNGNKSTN